MLVFTLYLSEPDLCIPLLTLEERDANKDSLIISLNSDEIENRMRVMANLLIDRFTEDKKRLAIQAKTINDTN